MTVWVYGPSRLVCEGLAHLLTELGAEVTLGAERPVSADVALWAPGSLGLPVIGPPALPTLVMIDAETSVLVELLASGYRGLLPNDTEPQQLRRALRAVLGGAVWAPRELMAQALSSLMGLNDSADAPTRREHDVLVLVGQGLSNRAIGANLGITERTVKAHVSNLLLKYRVRNRVELLVKASPVRMRTH